MEKNYYLCNRWRNVSSLNKVRIKVDYPTIVSDNLNYLTQNVRKKFC